jgi:hypothetical protein
MAPYYRKKPVVIEARYNDGTEKTARALMDWVNPDDLNEPAACVALQDDDGTWFLSIATLEGKGMKAAKGWWVIKGVKGEFYPCEGEIFEETYEDA